MVAGFDDSGQVGELNGGNINRAIAVSSVEVLPRWLRISTAISLADYPFRELSIRVRRD